MGLFQSGCIPHSHTALIYCIFLSFDIDRPVTLHHCPSLYLSFPAIAGYRNWVSCPESVDSLVVSFNFIPSLTFFINFKLDLQTWLDLNSIFFWPKFFKGGPRAFYCTVTRCDSGWLSQIWWCKDELSLFLLGFSKGFIYWSLSETVIFLGVVKWQFSNYISTCTRISWIFFC